MRTQAILPLLIVALCFSASSLGCGDDDSGGSGSRHVKVFVTEGEFTGNVGGLAGADLICTASARKAGLSGGWVAWLSDGNVDARDRILDAEYRLMDGQVVANDKADLTDVMLDLNTAIDLHASGAPNTGDPDVWTGTLASGLTDTTCSQWTNAGAANSGKFGLANQTGNTWTDSGSQFCDELNRLYCFSDDLVK